jgi:signal transduction histidine kinase
LTAPASDPGRAIGRPRPRLRIALRIYLVTVLAVLATTAAVSILFWVVRLRHAPGPTVLERDLARSAAIRVARGWTAADVDRGLAELEHDLGLDAAAFTWDGEPLSAMQGTQPRVIPLLSSEQRSRLASGDVVAVGDPGLSQGPHWVAAAVVRDGHPIGYVVLSAPAPRPADGTPRVPVAPPPGGASELPPPPFAVEFAASPAQVVPAALPAPSAERFIPPGLFVLALALVGLGIAAVLLGGSLARPLDRLARTAHAIGAGDLAARTGHTRDDELGAVARALDEMAGRVAGLLRGQTELIANVAHELRTPIARIRVALDLAAEGDAREARASLAEIAEDLAELEALVSDVLTAARLDLASGHSAGGAPPLRRASLELHDVAREAIARFQHRHPARVVTLEAPASSAAVLGDAVLLRRVLDNLLDNARKYARASAPIALRLRTEPKAAEIEVSDRGDGVAPEDLARLFTPFFRADRSRARATGGVGLGLALSRRIAEAHGGTLTARSVVGVGTTFTLRLPVRAD